MKRIIIFLLCILSSHFTLNAEEIITEKVTEERPPFSVNEFAKLLKISMDTSGPVEALKLFSSLPDEDAALEEVRYLKASILISAKKYDEARIIATELLSLKPQSEDYIFLNIIICKARGDKVEKKKLLERILSIDKNNLEALTELADEQMLAKNYKKAREYYERAISVNSNYSPAVFGLGKIEYYQNNVEAAKKIFKKLVKSDKKNTLAYSYLAKISMEEDDYVEAEKNLLAAIEIHPDNYLYWLELGECYRDSQKNDKAIEAFTKSITLNNKYFLTYLFRGSTYDAQENYEKALIDYLDVLTINPDYYLILEPAGQLAWKLGKWDLCAQLYKKLYTRNPQSVYFLSMYSAATIKNGQKAALKTYLFQNLKNFPKDSAGYSIARLFFDDVWGITVSQRIQKTEGKMNRIYLQLCLAVYYDAHQDLERARPIYQEIHDASEGNPVLQRFCLWGLDSTKND